MHMEFWCGGHLESGYLEDRQGDGRIISVRWILGKLHMIVGCSWDWLRIV